MSKVYVNTKKLNKDAEAANKLLSQIIDKVVEGAKVEIAEEIVDEEVTGMKHNMEEQMKQRGLDMKSYLQITGQTEEDLNKRMHEDAVKNLRAVVVMEKIANVENIVVGQEDLEVEFAKIADQYKMPVEQVKEILGKDMNRFASEIRQRRIQDFLIKENEKKAE